MSIEHRYTEGELDRLPDLAAELVRLNVDVIVTALLALFGLLRRRRQRFPLFSLLSVMQLTVGLFPAWQDQVETPLDDVFAPELDGKRLELLKESIS